MLGCLGNVGNPEMLNYRIFCSKSWPCMGVSIMSHVVIRDNNSHHHVNILHVIFMKHHQWSMIHHHDPHHHQNNHHHYHHHHHHHQDNHHPTRYSRTILLTHPTPQNILQPTPGRKKSILPSRSCSFQPGAFAQKNTHFCYPQITSFGKCISFPIYFYFWLFLRYLS